jgi:peptidyl-prolyl cis-trans isomerase C
MIFRNLLLTATLMSAVILVLSGCGSENKASASSKVLAEVNGEAVSEGMFDAYLDYKRIPKNDTKAVDRELSDYLERVGMAQVILSQKLLDPMRIETEVNEFKKQMLISRYFEQFLREKVNETAERNFYAANAERFQSKKAHVAHVLIRTNPKISQQEREALLTKAQEVYSKAMSNEEFAVLAQQYSDDTLSAKKGGDLGWITEGSIDPAFVNAAFGMKKGEISQPVVTPFGFHVIKVLEEAQIVKKPYESVKGDIRFELRQQAKKAEMDRLKTLVTIDKRG